MTPHPTGGYWLCSECLSVIFEGHICRDCYAILCETCAASRHHKPTLVQADPDTVGTWCPNVPEAEAA